MKKERSIQVEEEPGAKHMGVFGVESGKPAPPGGTPDYSGKWLLYRSEEASDKAEAKHKQKKILWRQR